MRLIPVLSSIFVFCLLNAQDYTNHKLGISFNIPSVEGWESPVISNENNNAVQNPVQLILNTTNKNTGKRFVLVIIKTDSLSNLSESEQRRGLKTGAIESMNNQGKVILEKMDTLANILSYEFTVIGDYGQGAMSFRYIFLVNDNFYYNFTLISNEINNLPDRDFTSIIKSIKFLKINAPPQLSMEKSSDSYNMGYKIGKVSSYIVLLILIAFGISKYRKRNKVA